MTAFAQRLERLKKYNLLFLRPFYAADYPQYAGRFDEIEPELKKFYELVLIDDGPLAAFGKPVDALWHTHILQTERYRAFCAEVFGEYIDHKSHSALSPVPGIALTNSVGAYTARFGELAPAWTEDIPPAYIAALKLGQVPPEMLLGKWSGWTGRRQPR